MTKYYDIGSSIQHQKHLCVTTGNWNLAPKNSSVKLRCRGEKSWELLVLSAAAEWIFLIQYTLLGYLPPNI